MLSRGIRKATVNLLKTLLVDTYHGYDERRVVVCVSVESQ
jgi:hypothetical protein